MTADDQHRWNQPPPPRPRRRNSLFLRLFDGPLYRDPLAWWTAGWALLSFFAILYAPGPPATTMPPLLNAFLAMLFFAAMLGLLPAAVRLQVRRVMWSRHERRRATASERASRPQQDAGGETGLRPPPTSAPRPPPAAPVTTSADTVQQRPTNPDCRRPTGTAPRRPPSGLVASRTIGPQDLADSAALTRARDLQFPVARAARAMQTARTAREGYDAYRDLTDSFIVAAAAASLSWIRSVDPSSPIPARIAEQYLRGLSLGTWRSAMGEVLAATRTMPGAPEPLAEAGRKRKGRSDLADSLNPLITERNDWAHGNIPRSEADAAHRLGDLLPTLEKVLEKADFLHLMPWVVVDSITFDARARSFEVSVRRAMHDNSEFDRFTLALPNPVSNQRVYQLIENVPVDLTPFVVVQDCADCRRSEMFYADKWRDNDVVLKSFVGTGHSMRVPELVDEMAQLKHPAD